MSNGDEKETNVERDKVKHNHLGKDGGRDRKTGFTQLGNAALV